VPSPYTQSLLLYAYQASARALVQTLQRYGHPQIRPKHGAVLANLDEHGTRSSTLAERAGIGRAAMGEQIDDLERLGYVRREPDPADRRAKLIVATDAARDVTRIVHEFNQNMEAQYRRELGDEAYDSLRESLRMIAPKDDMQPRIG
jgi:DNA-binding MarR family transcriptional regulator